jgi:hypothetical protein
MALVAVEVHGGDDRGPNVDTGRWNLDEGGTILAARLGNPIGEGGRASKRPDQPCMPLS